jgi:phosphoglycolate phosphatase-like HAD superfamily hydrolase
MLLAFDLDGTLADTRIAVREAYIRAGAPAHLIDANWGKPWAGWTDQETHARKNAIYLRDTINLVKRLPPMNLFQNKTSIILTGASLVAAEAVCKKLGLRPRNIFPELTAEGKADILDDMFPGMFIDDDAECCAAVSRRGKWSVLHFKSPL